MNKYRVWDKDDNRMITDTQYFIPLIITNKGILRLNAEHKENLYTLIPFGDRFILMRNVGFNDKNNKEIYEGDIDSSGCVVTYLANLNSGLGMNAGWYLQRDNFESWSELECNNDIEIIGNIFENPEKAINNCNTDYTKCF